jgi:hypothetical protein
MIPQIKNTVLCLLVILLGAPLAGAYFAWQTGEIHSFADLWTALQHGLFSAVMMAIGWILLKSPWAGRVTELVLSQKSAKGAETTATLKVTEPPVETK